jgi:hypothetical protein
MSTLRVCSVLATLALLGACTTPGRGSSRHAGKGDARNAQDTVRPTNGDLVQGRLLEDSGRRVVIDRETVVSAHSRGSNMTQMIAPAPAAESVGAADRPTNLGYNVGGVVVPIRRVQR